MTVGIQISISGTAVQVLEGSFSIDDAINAISTCQFTVRDDSGSNFYTKGQKISITDSVKGLYYTGFISTVARQRQSPNALIFSKVACQDNHVIPTRRAYQGKEYTNTYSGVITADMLSFLASDGITAQYASKRETTQAQLATGTLSNTTATANVGDGDLELALAGTPVSVTETGATFATGTVGNTTVSNGSLAQTPFNAIKIQSTNSINNAGNTFTYVKIWSGSYAIPAAPNAGFLVYDVFIKASSPEIKIGVDFLCSDGTTFRDNAVYTDPQGMAPHPKTDLTGLADGRWYHRYFYLNAVAGKTVSYVSVAIEGDKTGAYVGYFRNIFFANNSLVSTQNIFVDASTAISTVQQLQTYGYVNTKVSLVKCFNTFDVRTSPGYSLSAAGISASTLLTWTATTPNNSQSVVKYSLDAGASYIPCTNGAVMPDFPAGLSVSGQSIQFKQDLFIGDTPEDTPTLQSMTLSVTPGYNGTKADSLTFIDSNTAWAAGTTSNTTNNSGATLSLSGVVRNWDNADVSNQTLYGGGGPEISTSNRSLLMGTDSGFDARCKNVFINHQYQNFTAEVDIQVSTSIMGMVYRTTNWGNSNDSYAYFIGLTASALYMDRGNNTTGTGSVTHVKNQAISLTVGDWHRLKIDVNGSTHKAYIDDVLMFTQTDATYSAAGDMGFRIQQSSGSHKTGLFDNFGVVGTGAFSGTWLSPAISLNALGTYAASDLVYQDASTDHASCTIRAEYTINGGSTWTAIPVTTIPATASGGVTITNNLCSGSLPGLTVGQSLAGISLQLRFTLTTTTPSAQPAVDTVSLKILGGFSASGTRISSSLSLANVGRMGSSIVAWNDTLPAGTTLGVDVALDGGAWVDVSGSNGGTIPGLTVQPAASADTYNSNTSANYTSTNRTGGSVATWTYDTPNSRITATGGSSALYVWNSVTGVNDVDLFIDMDESDTGGVVWRYTDVNNFYELVVQDASSTGTQNIVALYKTVAGTRTQIGSNTAISFTRATYHRIHVTMKGTAIVVAVDNIQAISTTDTSLASGKTGLRTSGGTARFYQLRVQPLGQDVSAHSVQTRLRLASTDPTMTPQITDVTLAAFGNTIQVGALIPQTAYNGKYYSDIFDDLVKQCSATGGQWWWYLDKNKVAYLLPNAGMPAPWIASSILNPDGTGDFLEAGLIVTDESDNYCNRVIVENVLATATIDESRIGDGLTRSWTFGYEWASAPAISINDIPASVGVKNVDTGKTFYYAVGDNTITIDSAVTTFTSNFTLSFVGTGQYLTNSQYDNTTEQAALAALDGTTGIVEYVQDGTGLTKAAGDALAQALCTKNSVRGQKIDATTLRDGLMPGMLMNVFLPEHNIKDGLFLLRSMKTTLTPDGATGLHRFWYTLELINGPDVGSWETLYQKAN